MSDFLFVSFFFICFARCFYAHPHTYITFLHSKPRPSDISFNRPTIEYPTENHQLDKLLCADCDKFRCVCVQPELVRPSTLPPLRTAPGSTLLKRLSQKISAATSTNSAPAFETPIEDSATTFKAMAIGRDSSETAIRVSSPNVSNICYTRRISLDEQPLRHHPAIARSTEPTSMPTKPTQL